jgi:hypothetical protein
MPDIDVIIALYGYPNILNVNPNSSVEGFRITGLRIIAKTVITASNEGSS